MALRAPVEIAAGTGVLTNVAVAGLAALLWRLVAESHPVAERDRWSGESCVSCPVSLE